jgi:hypothetical protein
MNPGYPIMLTVHNVSWRRDAAASSIIAGVNLELCPITHRQSLKGKIVKTKSVKPVKIKKSKEPAAAKEPVNWPLIHAKNEAILHLHLAVKNGTAAKLRKEIIEAATVQAVVKIRKALPEPKPAVLAPATTTNIQKGAEA